MLLFRSRFPGLFPFSPAWFPVPSFRFCVLGFPFVSFRSSQLRSHGCSTGAHLVLCFVSSALLSVLSPSFLLPFVRFFSGSHYLALAFFFSLLPCFPLPGSFKCFLIRFPFRLLPCFRSCFGTQPSCVSFLRFSVSHHRCYFSRRPPVSSSVVPLCFRFRFRLFSFGLCTLKTEHHNHFFNLLKTLTEPALWSSFRLISISQLNVLPHLHP